jgi:cation transport ATPase
MIPEINYWAVLIGAVLSMGLGALWYSPVMFLDRWAKLARIDMDKEGQPVAIPMIVAFVVTFLTAWVLAGSVAIAWHFYGGGFFLGAIVTAVTLWAGFTAARVITHDVFEGRPSQLTVMTIGFELTTVLIMAVVIGLWPPAGTV